MFQVVPGAITEYNAVPALLKEELVGPRLDCIICITVECALRVHPNGFKFDKIG
jgi:hypothetical protein